MADRDIAVKFTGDSNDLERAARNATDAVDGTSKGFAGSFKSMTAGATDMLSAVGTAGQVVGEILETAWSFASAAMGDEAAASQLAQQLRTAAGASDDAVAGAEAYIAALSEQVAVADDELRPALSKLATASHDTGRAQELLGAATDIAAGSGKDLDTVATALAKAQLGQVDGLSRLGLETKNAAGETMTLDEILGKAKQTFGRAGKAAAETTEGGLKKMQIGFGEAQEAIGAKFLPAIDAAVGFMNDNVLPAFQTVMAWIDANWPRLVEAVAGVVDNVRARVEVALNFIRDLWAQWGDEVLAVVQPIIDFVRDKFEALARDVVAAVTWLIDHVTGFWAEWGDEIIGTLTTVGETIAGFIRTIIEVAQAIGARLSAFWDEWGDDIIKFVKLVIDLVKAIVDRVTSILRPALEAWFGLVSFAFNAIKTVVTVVFNALVGIIRGAFQIIGAVVGVALDAIRWVWDRWGEGIMAFVGNVFGIIGSIIRFALDVIVNVIRFFTSIFKGDWGAAFGTLVDTVKLALFFIGDLMGRIGGILVDALKGVGSLISAPFVAAFNLIADAWNNTIGRLSFTFPDWIPGLGGRTIDVPDLPRFGALSAVTIVMPPGSDGYDVARQLATFSRTVVPVDAMAVAVR